MVLNWDILFVILPNFFLGYSPWLKDARDLLAMMRTCHTLYKAGMPHLLNYIYLFDDFRRVADFACFALGDPQRPLLLRTFQLELSSEQKNLDFDRCASELGRLLQQAKNLKMFAIGPCVEHFVDANFEMALAIASLEKLTHLHLEGIGFMATRMLTALRSPLETVYLDFNVDGTVFSMDPQTRDVIKLLTNFSSRLKNVTIEFADFEPDQGISHPTVLDLTVYSESTIDIDTINAAFPNVQDFAWYPDSLAFDSSAATQMRTDREEVDWDDDWESLDTLHAGILEAYGLRLQCPVREWRGTGFSPQTIHQLRQVLEDISPSHVSVFLGLDEWSKESISELFDRVTDLPSISHLEIEVELDHNRTTKHISMVRYTHSLHAQSIANVCVLSERPDQLCL